MASHAIVWPPYHQVNIDCIPVFSGENQKRHRTGYESSFTWEEYHFV
jgi:hypothetical protein